MTNEKYIASIPIQCKYQTLFEHMHCLGLCYSIWYGYIKSIGIEGPQYCHNCIESIKAKRWGEILDKKLLKNLL